MNKGMRISAVIPAYNAESFIRQALESIQHQTRPIDEIIVVDDGSTDNTEALIHAMAPDAIYLRQKNQGPSAARNRAIEAASGDWIAFLDADDQWTPEKTATQLAVLARHPTLCLIAADMTEIDTLGKQLTPSVLAKHQQQAFFQALDGAPIPKALSILVKKNFIPTGTVLVKREVLIEAACFSPDIRFGEDLELWAKIACHHPITCLPKQLMHRRQHGANATQNTGPMLADLVKVMRSIGTYGATQLQQQGIDPATLIAAAIADLGYWQFSQASYREARRTFFRSLKTHINKRALFYAIVCLLPNKLIKEGKALKQRLGQAH